MTGWDVLNGVINNFSPVAVVAVLVAAAITFVIGFSRRGMNFIKYGFGKTTLDSSLEKRFDDLSAKMAGMASKEDIKRLEAATKEDIKRLETATKEDIKRLETATKEDIKRLENKIEAIEVNHFGHLKNYLGVLNGVLLDKDIIDNETKARLDNELRGM